MTPPHQRNWYKLSLLEGIFHIHHPPPLKKNAVVAAGKRWTFILGGTNHHFDSSTPPVFIMKVHCLLAMLISAVANRKAAMADNEVSF